MGLFSRRSKPAIPTAPVLLPQNTPMAYPPAPSMNPPPYFQGPPLYDGNQNSTCYPPQQQLSHYPPQDDRFMSVQDFQAIQQATNQETVIDQFNDIITNIDEDRWNENDEDLSITVSEDPNAAPDFLTGTTRAIVPSRISREGQRTNQLQAQKITIWSKVSFYANSRLPDDLQPLKVYIPTWPLICLAAQYSANAYKAPASSIEREAFVSADARLGTKAMVMKSVPCDDKKTLVFAIRGTSTLSVRDWNVNLHTAPVSPKGFLDDEGNLCHEGFLKVAKAMIRPIAMRLRALLEENPSRASCSLLITGHSAGGAVAALLYSHMISSVRSELSILTDCFKRVHCITFGSPPVSLLPLAKPHGKRYAKSIFFSFINEGDPVVRAEKAYLWSLIELLSSPYPSAIKSTQRNAVTAKTSLHRLQQSVSKLDLNNTSVSAVLSSNALKTKISRINFSQSNMALPPSFRPAKSSHSRIWPIPDAILSNAGRLVIMRVPHQPVTLTRKGTPIQTMSSNSWEKEHLSKVTAHTVVDDHLRNVIFGDPGVHAMQVYLRRVDMLALKAVTARG